MASTGSWSCNKHCYGFWLVLGNLFCAQAFASVNICSNDFNSIQSQAIYSKSGSTSVTGFPGSVDRQLVGLDLIAPIPETEKRQAFFGGGHRYTIFDIKGVATQSNGHVHTLFLPYFHQQRGEHGRLQFRVAPAISASSNIIKNTGNWRHESMQLLGGVRYETNNGWFIGGCADYRFGEFKLYPVFGVQVIGNDRWQVSLGLPDAWASYRVRDGMKIEMRFGPDGNQWEVADEQLLSRSRFGYRAYELAMAWRWQVRKRMVLSVSVARRFSQQLDLLRVGGNRVILDVADSNAFGASVHWRFGNLNK